MLLLRSIIAAVLLVPLSLASPIEERSAATIVQGITKVQSDIAALSKTLDGFQANSILSGFTALQIEQQTKQIETDLQSLTKTTAATPNLSSDDSNTVAQAVFNLVPSLRDILNKIVVKKPAFATAVLLVGDLSQTVEQSLKTQQSLANQFGQTLTPKLAQPYQGFAPSIISTINGYFNTAIAAYDKCTGLICLPPIPGS